LKALIILALALTGCSALEQRHTDLIEPPKYTDCVFPQQLLVCNSADLTECDGYLKDKPLTIIREIE